MKNTNSEKTNAPDNRDREENQTTKLGTDEVSGSSDCSFSGSETAILRRPFPRVRLHRVDRNGIPIETYETTCTPEYFTRSSLNAIYSAMSIIQEAYENGFDDTRSSGPESIRFERVRDNS